MLAKLGAGKFNQQRPSRCPCPAILVIIPAGGIVSSVSVYLLALLHIAPASIGVYHILLYKRDSRAAMGWIMACMFIPYGGPVAYFLFGINRVRTRARGIRRRLFTVDYETAPSESTPLMDYGQGLAAIGHRVTGTPLSAGNSVETYHNGEEAYPAMIAAIGAARQRILLTAYILKTDITGSAFGDALAAAVKRNVDVKVLIDGIGELYAWPRPSRQLRGRGISVARFLPPKLFPPSIYVNLRNHRKLLVVDNDIAFAGGMNISDDHTSFTDHPRRVSDIHFRFRGPVTTDLAAVFFDDWEFATGETRLSDEPPAPATQGSARCRVIPDGPDEALDALSVTIQSVIGAASHSVDIMTPYFLPSRELIAALQSATLRGVKVRVVLPGKNNLFYVHWANRNMLAELLNWNVEAFYQPAPFCHSKLLCVDDEYCMVGSANLDPRSLRLNFELGIEIFSATLNSELRSHFDTTLASSTRITLESLAARSVPVRLRDSFVSLFAPYL
jgi:cardiolipin synthase